MSLSKSSRINEALQHIDIKNFLDVIFHLPRTYDDFTITKEPVVGDKARVVFFGSIVSIPRIIRVNKLTIVSFSFLSTSGYTYRVSAFNRPYLVNTIKYGQEMTLVGILDKTKREINLSKIVNGQLPENKRLQSVYSLPNSLQNFEFIKLVEKAFKFYENQLDDVVPQNLRIKYHLLARYEALRRVHFPQNFQDVNLGLRTLKYEEALLFQTQNLLIRQQNKTLIRQKKQQIDLKVVNHFIASLPYKLTTDQIEAVREIGLDMNQEALMYRLLQGDVGTGKTLVAFISLYINYLRGSQGALMVPTDILARQHYESALTLFKHTSVRIGLLVGALKEKEKNDIKARLQRGDIDLIIGTHALFTTDVDYAELGLVIIDEQHRFGVDQRQQLLKKGDKADLLLMSATPIPRSLALTLYGDLDLTTLKQFPFAKRHVDTRVISPNQEEINQHIDAFLHRGKQVFIVAPRIEGDEETSVETLFKKYQKQYGSLVGLVHGRLLPEEKELAFADFKSGKTPILVATSVIEVGVDVKSAGLLLIYSPMSFGLSALHQLRGRIGRDGKEALCLLISEEEDSEKLKVLETLNDGFKIAEADLALRGPGEVIGVKQSGIPNFTCLNLISDIKIFQTAREDALKLISRHQTADEINLISLALNKIKA